MLVKLRIMYDLFSHLAVHAKEIIFATLLSLFSYQIDIQLAWAACDMEQMQLHVLPK